MTALDPKPWFCLTCSDRFARKPSARHDAELRPRKQYEQSRVAYVVRER